MYSLLISLLPLIIIVYYFRMLKNRDSIAYYLNNGARCYSCKKELFEKHDDKYFSHILAVEKSGKRDLRLCKCCERDKSINILFSKKKDTAILALKRFILTEKYRKIQQKVLFSCLFLPILGIVLSVGFKMKNNLSEASSAINFVIWIFMLFQLKVSTVPKEKEKK